MPTHARSARSPRRSPNRRQCLVESFEARLLFHVEVQQPIPDQGVAVGGPATTIDLAGVIFNEELGPVVRLDYGTVGAIDIQLLEQEAPLSVANFLNYVTNGTYNNTVMHRSEPGFVIQGGGYTPTGADITPPGTATVPNEFSPQRSNVRGTVAYAKLSGDPNSATSEFFFNLADNSANLDVQNGGFTVFANVLGNGMAVADAIAALARVNASPLGTAFNHLPVTRTTDPALTPVDPATGVGPEQTPQADQMVVLNRATVISQGGPMTYSATSSNPALVTAEVVANQLVLNYAPGQTGTATITVTGVGEGGGTATDTFDVTINPEVTVGQGAAARAVQFTDGDGTVSRLTVNGGSATLRFSGTGVTAAPAERGVVVVTGTNVGLAGLILTGTNPGVTVTSTGGDGRVVFNGITAEGPVRSVTGPAVVLRGPAVFNNAVGRLNIARSEAATITIRRSGSAGFVEPLITIGEAVDTDIDSQAPLKLRLGGWTGSGGATDADRDIVTAPAIRTMLVNGDFVGDLNVSGNGQRVGSPAVASARVDGTLSGTWNVGSLNALRAGSITNAVVRSDSFIRSVLTGSVSGSTVFAGVANTVPAGTRPGTAAALGTGSIRSFAVRGRSTTPQFANSHIAASSLGRMSLGMVQENNAGTAFGLVGDSVAAVNAVTAGGQAIRGARLTDLAQSIDQTDFEVRVF